MRVLLIENDHDISSFIKIGLEYHGIIVDTELDGLNWEIRTFSREYDVIVLDPEIAGNIDLEFCNKIMINRKLIPVLMLISIEYLVTGLDCRCDEYLIKPFKFDDLLTRLKSIVKTLS